MPLQRCTSLWMSCRTLEDVGIAACSCREFEPASAQAAIVANGLLISCMTPAARVPIAASFSAWAKRSCAERHSLTSSPTVITCVTGPSSRPHRDLRNPVGSKLSRRHRFHLEDLKASSREHFVELAAQHRGRLPVQDLEDRATDRFISRHALHARLALAVPARDAIVAIDDVESHAAASR